MIAMPHSSTAAMPIFRGLSVLGFYARFIADPIGSMRRSYAANGPLSALGRVVPFGRERLSILAVGPRYNQRVLSDIEGYRTAGIILPGPKDSAQSRLRIGLVQMNGPHHAHYRRLLVPPLRRPKVDAMAARMAAIVDDELDHWPLGDADLWALCQRLVQRVSMRLLFAARDDEEDAICAAGLINTHFRMNGSRAVLGCPIDLPGTPYRRLLRHAEATEKHLLAWAKRRQGAPPGADLLSVVVNSPDEAGHRPHDRRIIGQVPTLYGASYETCQTALTWALFLIAQHPAAAHSLLDEVQALPEDPAALAASLDRAVLLDHAIKESMRLLTSVPFQIRVATRDTDLVDVDVKAGTRVYLSPFMTHRLPEIFPDPDRFKPERWDSADPSPFEYLTFSAGPRLCIGYWFGMTVLKMALARAMRRFRVSVHPDARIDRYVSVTLSPRRGLKVRIAPQDRAYRRVAFAGDINELVDFA